MQRIKNGKKEVYVPGHPWKNGRATSHPGYWRSVRPKGRKKIIGKKPVRLYSVTDQYGQFKGWSTKKGR